jgi:hypothetical protein
VGVHPARPRSCWSLGDPTPTKYAKSAKFLKIFRKFSENYAYSLLCRKSEACRIKAAMATDRVTRAEWIMSAHGWEELARQAEKDEKPD